MNQVALTPVGESDTNASASRTLPTLYAIVLIECVAEIAVVFSPAIGFRLTHDGWRQNTVDTLLRSPVLDAHVAIAALLYAVLIAQVVLGAWGASTSHRRLGRVVLAAFVPMYIGAIAIVVFNPVYWSPYVTFLAGLTLVAQATALTEGVIAAKRRQWAKHIDAMYILFVLFASLATIRVVVIGWYVSTGTILQSTPVALGTYALVQFKAFVPVLWVRKRLSVPAYALAAGVGAIILIGWGLTIGTGLPIGTRPG